MSEPVRLLTAAEVAEKLRRSVGWFYRHREELERDEGFPPPRRRGLWVEEHILAWIRGDFLAGSQADERALFVDNQLARDELARERTRRELAERAAAIAAGIKPRKRA